jgi:hypothetical protein
MRTRNVAADDQNNAPEPLVVDKRSAEYTYWLEYAHLALEFDKPISEVEQGKEPTNMREYVGLKYGASPATMNELTMYL